jgi:hypothetical protein
MRSPRGVDLDEASGFGRETESACQAPNDRLGDVGVDVIQDEGAHGARIQPSPRECHLLV